MSNEELSKTESILSQIDQTSFTVPVEGFIFKRKNENTSSLRLTLTATPELLSLSNAIFGATSSFDTPISTPVNTVFHITLCTQVSNEELKTMQQFMEMQILPKKILINQFSIFYSTFNTDKPSMAYEVKKFMLKN